MIDLSPRVRISPITSVRARSYVCPQPKSSSANPAADVATYKTRTEDIVNVFAETLSPASFTMHYDLHMALLKHHTFPVLLDEITERLVLYSTYRIVQGSLTTRKSAIPHDSSQVEISCLSLFF